MSAAPERERVLAFRARRLGLAHRADSLADALPVPASDFHRDGALLAVAARAREVTRDAWDAALDTGEVVMAFGLRGALHAVAPADVAVFGSALVSRDPDELIQQLGPQQVKMLGDLGMPATEALGAVVDATRAIWAADGALDRVALHAAWRQRLPDDLLPWCAGCKSHHVAPMLWRYALAALGARRLSDGRFAPGSDSPPPPSPAGQAARRFLAAYGPATERDYAGWAGVSRAAAARDWTAIADETVPAGAGRNPPRMVAADAHALADAEPVNGVRLLPPGDPYLQAVNRALLVPDPALRKALFRPVAGPGAIVVDGDLAGLWRTSTRGGRLDVRMELLTVVDRDALAVETRRVADARGVDRLQLHID